MYLLPVCIYSQEICLWLCWTPQQSLPWDAVALACRGVALTLRPFSSSAPVEAAVLGGSLRDTGEAGSTLATGWGQPRPGPRTGRTIA